MGHLAALLSRTGEDVFPVLKRMLEAATSRTGDSYGFASEDGTFVSHSLRDCELESTAVIGYRLEKVTQYDMPKPVVQSGAPMILEGRLWNTSNRPDTEEASERLGSDLPRGIAKLIRDTQASFVVLALDGRTLLCGRDPMGTIPAYMGVNPELIGLASNRKMLWSAGLDAESLPPGHMAVMGSSGVELRRIRTLQKPPPRRLSMEEAVERLDQLITRAVERRTRGVHRASLGFSGGIDSTITAHYLSKAGVDLDPICVGLEGSEDFNAAETAANALDLPIRLESKTKSDVEDSLDNVLWAVEEPNPMMVSIALPLNWAAKSASEYGNTVFFSGNGSDELFAGYQKHVRKYGISEEAVMDEVFKDVTQSYKVNFERDHKVCSENGLELRLPLADEDLVQYGLSIPVELKLSLGERPQRKLVLRELARRLGLPDELSSRKKKAIQYSTGVDKALKRLARAKGMSLQTYLSDRLQALRRDRLDPGDGLDG
jgi:asparagine synthase (glutamine-hydrolysing)